LTICAVAASKIRYEITKGNQGGAFAVKNMTGAIYVAGPLDYEVRKRVSPINCVKSVEFESRDLWSTYGNELNVT
jgi:Cadherin domain